MVSVSTSVACFSRTLWATISWGVQHLPFSWCWRDTRLLLTGMSWLTLSNVSSNYKQYTEENINLWHVYNKILQKCIYRLHHVCLNIHPSVHRVQQLTNHCLDFHKIWCSSVLLTFVDTYQFWLKSENNNVHFTLRSAHISTFISSITQMYLTKYI